MGRIGKVKKLRFHFNLVEDAGVKFGEYFFYIYDLISY